MHVETSGARALDGAERTWRAHALLAAVWVALLAAGEALENAYREGGFAGRYPLPAVAAVTALWLLPTAWVVVCAWKARMPSRGQALALFGWAVAAGTAFGRSFSLVRVDEVVEPYGSLAWLATQAVLRLFVLSPAVLVMLWKVRPERHGRRGGAADIAIRLAAVAALFQTFRGIMGNADESLQSPAVLTVYTETFIAVFLFYCAVVLDWAILSRRATRGLPAPRRSG